MTITGLGTVILLAIGAVVLLSLTVRRWDRGRARRTKRALGLLACQLLLLLTIAAAANRQLRWFSSWTDLVGAGGSLKVSASAHGRLDGQLAKAAHRPGHGSIISWSLAGQSSKVTLPAKVYLPAAYFSGSGQRTTFPVIELLAGFPGGPETWIHPLHIARVIDQEINAGRMAPAIVVMPVQNLSAWRDSECVNAQHGAQIATLLTSDLRMALSRDFRTATTGNGWGLMGYSTGGFCAVNLSLQHSDIYNAAVSLSGYFKPLTDASTGDLYRGSRSARTTNNPLWRVQHGAFDHAHAPYLYLAASSGDGTDVKAIRELQRASPSNMSPTVAILPAGGHNFRVWRELEPAALDWLSAHLAPPLTAPVTLPGQQPKPVTASKNGASR